jgi:hypothetical protein
LFARKGNQVLFCEVKTDKVVDTSDVLRLASITHAGQITLGIKKERIRPMLVFTGKLTKPAQKFARDCGMVTVKAAEISHALATLQPPV